jgi:retinol dehydrogenase 14
MKTPSKDSRKIVVITGATSGIGLETVKALDNTHTIYILARNPQKAQTLCDQLKNTKFIVCDMGDLQSIVNACAQLKTQISHIDILIHNAGILQKTFKKNPQGFELTFATNHLGPFLLQRLLDSLLVKQSRVIVVSSYAHTMARVRFSDLQLTNSYSGWLAYANTKLYNIYFTIILAKKLESRHITVNCLHPGVVYTNLFDKFSGLTRISVIQACMNLFFLTPKQGAKTTIYLATSPDVQSTTARYFNKCKPARISKLAQDIDFAKRIWSISEDYVKPFLKQKVR